MRSRFSAYALDINDYIWRTWHPKTRPDSFENNADLKWQRLEILDTIDGDVDDQTGIVEFRVHYRIGKRLGNMWERSRFSKRADRWFYLDGETD